MLTGTRLLTIYLDVRTVQLKVQPARGVHKRPHKVTVVGAQRGTCWGWVVNATPRPFTSREEPRYAPSRRRGRHRGRSERLRKISPPSGGAGFEPQTSQPIVNDSAILADSIRCFYEGNARRSADDLIIISDRLHRIFCSTRSASVPH